MRGFTLWEVLLVLTLIGILTAMSVPALQHFYLRQSSELLQAQLLQAITLANQEAHAQYVPILLSWTNDQITLSKTNSNGERQVIFMQQMNARWGKLQGRSYPSYRHDLLIDPNNMMHNDNGTLWFCAAGKSIPDWAIIVNKAARAYIARDLPTLSHLSCA